jgi:hypothetical protein
MVVSAVTASEQLPPADLCYRVALIRWENIGNGIGHSIYQELTNLGHEPFYFAPSAEMREPAEILFLYGPFDRFLHVLHPLLTTWRERRPTVVFWNTEGLPDLRIPWPLMTRLAFIRSWLGRYYRAPTERAGRVGWSALLTHVEQRFLRFRYLGDMLYARRQGWIDVFADISAVYAQLFTTFGFPTLAAPFGGFSEWYTDLNCERDIDVLWMGKRATARRSRLLDSLRQELRRRGTDIYMVDSVERPFVFDDERTQLLNRTKIALNLLRTWYDENSLRFCMAAPNRALIVTEPLLAHVPQYQAGIHYVAAPIEQLADTIVYYLQQDEERERIVDSAYQLVTTELTMRNTLQKIMAAATAARRKQER